MHSPDGTVDEEDVAPRRLSLIKTSGGADGRDDMFDSSKKSMCNSTPAAPYFVIGYTLFKLYGDKIQLRQTFYFTVF